MQNAVFRKAALLSLPACLLLLLLSTLVSGCEKDSPAPADAGDGAEGMVGSWVSAGGKVSPFLRAFAGVDSVHLTFEANMTYAWMQADTLGQVQRRRGTYAVRTLDSLRLYELELTQLVPAATFSRGMLAIYPANPDSMWLEVVQTEPYIGATPPSPARGFGSSSEGALGTSNIQRFSRVVE